MSKNKINIFNLTKALEYSQLIANVCNVLIVVSIVIAVFQFYQSQNHSEKNIAIEAIIQTKSKEFIEAYTHLKTFYVYNKNNDTNKLEIEDELIDDYNYTMSIYEHIAYLYNFNIAEKCIIKQIQSDIIEFSNIVKLMKFKPTDQFEIFVADISQLKCN